VIEIHHGGGRGLAEARRLLETAIEYGEEPMAPPPLVLERIGVVNGG